MADFGWALSYRGTCSTDKYTKKTGLEQKNIFFTHGYALLLAHTSAQSPQSSTEVAEEHS